MEPMDDTRVHWHTLPGVWAFWFALALHAGLVVWLALAGPDVVASHAGLDGTVDAWQSRTAAVVTWTVMGVVQAVVWTGLGIAIVRIPAAIVNVPHPEYWKRPEHLGQLRRTSISGLSWFAAMTAVLLVAVLVGMVSTSGWARQLPTVALVVYLVATVLWIVVFVRSFRVPEDPADSWGDR